MSYIRCLSNPEGLYVYGDCDNMINFSIANEFLSREVEDDLMQMPGEVFDGLMKKYVESYGVCLDHPVEYKGAQIAEIRMGKEYKIRLSYIGWNIFLWRVTFDYMIKDYEFELWQKNHRLLLRVNGKIQDIKYAIRRLFRKFLRKS